MQASLGAGAKYLVVRGIEILFVNIQPTFVKICIKLPSILVTKNMTWIIYASSFLIFACVTKSQDIKFPEDDGTEEHLSGNSHVLTERVPLYIADRCPLNMLLYPGDGNTSAWECDCRPGFLYFPLNNSCHSAYRQGPCPSGSYAILPEGEVIPKCERNPCSVDGIVPYSESCYPLKVIGKPCSPNQYLDVNETTFKLQCMASDIETFTIINAPVNRCPAGSRRNALGQCRKTI